MTKPYGMCPEAWAAFQASGIDPERIGQTIGTATASAGTHEKDGTGSDGQPYAVCVDLSVKRPSVIGEDVIKQVLRALSYHGFAAFYRKPGSDHWPADQVEHIHAVYVGAPMKPICQAQVHDWCNGKNGLASHAPYAFYQPEPNAVNAIRKLFLANNPAETG